jgi:hypothetical protein
MNTITQLRDKKFVGYLKRRLPHELDTVVDSVVDGYRHGNAQTRAATRDALNPGIATVLSAYGQRVAARAVRRRSAADLSRALVGLGLAHGALEDWRDNLYGLTAVGHSAQLLGEDLEALVDGVAAELPTPAVAALRDFFRQDPSNRSLSSMGLAAQGAGDDFLYVSGPTDAW